MTRFTNRALTLTVWSLALAGTLAACGGSGSSSAGSSPSKSPSASAPPPSPKAVQAIPEHLTAAQAARVRPRVSRLPGVADVLYQPGKEMMWVYLDPDITKKQRTRIQIQLAHASAR